MYGEPEIGGLEFKLRDIRLESCCWKVVYLINPSLDIIKQRININTVDAFNCNASEAFARCRGNTLDPVQVGDGFLYAADELIFDIFWRGPLPSNRHLGDINFTRREKFPFHHVETYNASDEGNDH